MSGNDYTVGFVRIGQEDGDGMRVNSFNAAVALFIYHLRTMQCAYVDIFDNEEGKRIAVYDLSGVDHDAAAR